MSRKLLALLFISFLFFGCKNKDPYHGEYINLSFKQKVAFGQPDSLSESTIQFARFARVGPNGNIYVADAGIAKIKVYSPAGKLINSFGRRGRGPGEFTDIRGFAVTDSTVLVWDQGIQRMTVFGLDGHLHTIHNLKGLPTPMHIYPLKNSYLILHGDKYGRQFKKAKLGHIYSADFSKRNANFLTLNDVNDNIENLSELIIDGVGSVLVQNHHQFLYIPIIYGGNIYEYSKTSKGWLQTHIYKGLNQQKPFSMIKEGDSKRKADGSISTIFLSKDKSFIAHNWSRGLFKYDGYIFHFTFSDIMNKRVFGVEVYDKDVMPVGYAPIKSIPITDREGNALLWGVADVDKKGNFYFVQHNDKGTKIRLMHINQEDLKKLSE